MSKILYSCNECGFETLKWMGKCTQCGVWGSLKEIEVSQQNSISEKKRKGKVKVKRLSSATKITKKRIKTGFSELDRVLGGGIVKGEVILVGGEPGVGKTTLLLQTLSNIHSQKIKCIYVSSEESFEQISLHGKRLRFSSKFDVICSDDIDSIIETVRNRKCSLVVLDSVQTVKTEDMRGLPGGIGQVKECAARIVDFAKHQGTSVFLVGHITKDGTIAGPKVLEHLVDAVLYLEGDATQNIRIVRGVKNRFGSTKEIGVFSFDNSGFQDANNPAEMFVRSKKPSVGISKGVMFEGNRAILVEVQALISRSSFNIPQRIVSGVGRSKIQMLCAVLSKYTKADLSTRDVYVNIANGLKVDDSSFDLAICIAMLSSYLDKKVDSLRVAIGEVSLTGKVQGVYMLIDKIRALKRLGYDNMILPAEASSIVRNSKKISFVESMSSIDNIL